MRTEDGDLIRQCLTGDSTAFGFLVNKYKEPVYACAYTKVRNFADAQDLTQEVFIKAYQNLGHLKYYDRFAQEAPSWFLDSVSHAMTRLSEPRLVGENFRWLAPTALPKP